MDKYNVKIFSCILAIIIILIIMISLICTKISNKKNIFSDGSENNNLLWEYFIVYTSENAGIIDKNGNLIINTSYDEIDIPNPYKDVFFCYIDEEKYVILNRNGEQIFNGFNVSGIQINSELRGFEKNCLKYEKDGKYGLIDFDGNILTEAKYNNIVSLKDKPGVLLVKENGKYGILAQNGNIIIPTEYDGIASDKYSSEENLYLKTGYIISIKESKGINYGYIDYNGNLIVEPKYESIERVQEYNENALYLIAMQNGKKGVLNENKKIIDFNFQNIVYKSNVFVVEKNGKYGFYSNQGKMILKPKYIKYAVAGNYISVEDEDNVKLYDINGNLVNSNGYIEMIATDNSEYFIAKDTYGYYSIISKNVNIENEFTSILYAFDDYFIYTKDRKSGILNASTGEYVIDAKYDYIFAIDKLKALDAIDNENNIIDIYSEKLEKVITMEAGIASSVNKDFAKIYSENDVKYINSVGEVVSNREVYPDLKLYSIKQNDKWGFVDNNGNIVVECKYDIVTEYNKYGYAGIKIDGKWGVIDENGSILVEPQYEITTFYFPQFIGKYLLLEYETTYCEEIENIT